MHVLYIYILYIVEEFPIVHLKGLCVVFETDVRRSSVASVMDESSAGNLWFWAAGKKLIGCHARFTEEKRSEWNNVKELGL